MVRQDSCRVVLSCEVKGTLLLTQKSTENPSDVLSTTENKGLIIHEEL